MITAILGVVAILVWVSFEVLLRAPGAASSWRVDSRDRGSTAILTASFVLAALLPPALTWLKLGSIGQAAWFGVLIAALGLGLRAWSMRTLGASYSRTLRTSTDQRLVTSGPYRMVRHRGYTGSIAVWVGAALALHNWLAAAIVLVLMAGAYGWRISAEERMLRDNFADEFRAYSAHTWRLFPGLY